MRAYSLAVAAKINLYLEILGDRPDGYHELAMVMQSIDLRDRIELHPLGKQEFQVRCDHPEVPADHTNLAYRAAQLMAQQFTEAFDRRGGATITIHKQIPVGAGLAGGSTNAAGVLVGLDLMWDLGLTQSELQELAARLGSDIPFCIAGGTALATGRGEQISPLPDLDHLWVVLGKYRHLSVSTAWAYQSFRQKFGHSYVREPEKLADRRSQVRSGPMLAAITQRDGDRIGALLTNDLEKVVLPAYPAVQSLRDIFEQQSAHCGGLGTLMSGSGSTIFTLVRTPENAEALCAAIRSQVANPELDLWVSRFSPTGIQIGTP